MNHGGRASSRCLSSASFPYIVHDVERKQGISPETGQTSERVPAQVYVDADQWEKFATVARAQNRSRSAQVRELIRREIDAHPELEQAA